MPHMNVPIFALALLRSSNDETGTTVGSEAPPPACSTAEPLVPIADGIIAIPVTEPTTPHDSTDTDAHKTPRCRLFEPGHH